MATWPLYGGYHRPQPPAAIRKSLSFKH